MAREILKDETFRAEMQALIRKHFRSTLQQLAEEASDEKSDEA